MALTCVTVTSQLSPAMLLCVSFSSTRNADVTHSVRHTQTQTGRHTCIHTDRQSARHRPRDRHRKLCTHTQNAALPVFLLSEHSNTHLCTRIRLWPAFLVSGVHHSASHQMLPAALPRKVINKCGFSMILLLKC